MTLTPPQPEYIITEEQLEKILLYIQHLQPTTERIVEQIRSHPVPPRHTNPNVFAYNEDCDCQVCKDAREQHDNQIRNATLCELLAYINPDSRAGIVIKEKIDSISKEQP